MKAAANPIRLTVCVCLNRDVCYRPSVSQGRRGRRVASSEIGRVVRGVMKTCAYDPRGVGLASVLALPSSSSSSFSLAVLGSRLLGLRSLRYLRILLLRPEQPSSFYKKIIAVLGSRLLGQRSLRHLRILLLRPEQPSSITVASVKNSSWLAYMYPRTVHSYIT